MSAGCPLVLGATAQQAFFGGNNPFGMFGGMDDDDMGMGGAWACRESKAALIKRIILSRPRGPPLVKKREVCNIHNKCEFGATFANQKRYPVALVTVSLSGCPSFMGQGVCSFW